MTKKSFGFNVVIRFISKIILQLKNLIFLFLISKYLTVTDYGLYTQVQRILVLLVPVLILKLDVACIRYLSGNNKKNEIKNMFFSILFFVWLFLAIFIVLIYIFKGDISNLIFGSEGEKIYFNIFLILLWIRSTYKFLHNYYRMFNRIKKYSIIDVVNNLIIVILSACFLLKGKGIVYILTSIVIVEFFISLYIIIDIINELGYPNKISISLLKPYLSYSSGLIPVSLLYWVINYSDRLIIINFLDVSSVGIYSASYSLGRLIKFILTPLSFVLFPTVSKLWTEGKENKVRFYIEKSIKYYLLFVIPSVFGIYKFSPFILKLIATEEFITNKLLVLYIALGFLCIGIYQIFFYIIQLKERTKYLFIIFGLVALINVFLNFVLIPKIGITGAAISTFIAYLIQMIIIVFIANKLFPISVNLKYILKIVFSSMIMYIYLNLFTYNNFLEMLVLIFSGALLYFISMLGLRGISKKEMTNVMKSIIKF